MLIMSLLMLMVSKIFAQYKRGEFKSSAQSLKIYRLRKNLEVKTHSNMNIGYAVAQIHCTDVNHVVADANGVKDFGTSRQPHRFPNFLN